MNSILIIDDREENRVILRYILEGSHRVLEAADGVTGLAMAERERPDCILLDINNVHVSARNTGAGGC